MIIQVSFTISISAKFLISFHSYPIKPMMKRSMFILVVYRSLFLDCYRNFVCALLKNVISPVICSTNELASLI
jgi:hypothetical protein